MSALCLIIKKWNWTDEFQALSGILSEKEIQPSVEQAQQAQQQAGTAKLRALTEANSCKIEYVDLDLWSAAEMWASQVPGVFFLFFTEENE